MHTYIRGAYDKFPDFFYMGIFVDNIFKRACPNFLPYLPTPPLGQDMTHGQFLTGV